jgi:hypothetical protein
MGPCDFPYFLGEPIPVLTEWTHGIAATFISHYSRVFTDTRGILLLILNPSSFVLYSMPWEGSLAYPFRLGLKFQSSMVSALLKSSK